MEEGLTFKEIAVKFKCGVGMIRKIVKRHKMPIIRGPSKYRKIILEKSKLPLSIAETDIYDHVDKNIPPELLEVIFGTLLGDSDLRLRKCKKSNSFNVRPAHSIDQMEYLKWKHSFFGEQFANPIGLGRKGGPGLIKGKPVIQKDLYAFSSKPFSFDYIYEMLYENGRKIIHRKYLKYLTPLSLAVWYQDDGSYNEQNRVIRIATMCFGRTEHDILKDYFFKNLRMPSFIEKVNCGTGVSLVLTQNSTRKFLKLTAPYMHKTMEYKWSSNPSETLKAGFL